jgi:hypothetical protein
MNGNLRASLKSVGIRYLKFTTQHRDAIWLHQFKWTHRYEIGTRDVRTGAGNAPAQA